MIDSLGWLAELMAGLGLYLVLFSYGIYHALFWLCGVVESRAIFRTIADELIIPLKHTGHVS